MKERKPRGDPAGLNSFGDSEILKALSEEPFGDLTRLAAQLCSAPIAFIHVLQNNRHYIKSEMGLEVQANPPDLPFFSQAILHSDVFVVPDTSVDERFSANPRVASSPPVRFYAGVPLITAQGEGVGALSVMGPTPKTLQPDQIESLRTVARQVIQRFDLWSHLVELRWSANERKLFEGRLAAEHAITRILAQSRTLSEAASSILRVVCESLGWRLGIFWKSNNQVRVLTCVDAWRAPSTNTSGFEAISRESLSWPDEGLPGRVWISGEPDWIVDVAQDPHFERASIAEREGLHGAFAFPIRGQNQVLGVMEFFASERREPDENLLEMMSSMGTQIGQFMERKGAEETLIQWAAIVASSNDAIIGKTLDGMITSWNMGAQKLFGYSSEEMVGQPISILLPSDRIDELEEILARIRLGEPVNDYETVRIRKDGERIYVSMLISPIKDNAGKIIGASSINRDITERKRAEAALRASEARFRRLAESNIQGIIFWDVDGNITEANDAFLKMVGYTRKDLLSGKIRWRDMTPEEYRPLDERGLQEIAETGACTPFEKEYLHKDGSRIPVLIGAALLEGFQDRGICFVIDLTDRKEMEKALRESEARKRAILESSLDCIITIDHEGKVLEFNPAAESTFGYRRAEVIGKEMAELIVPPSLRDRHRAGLAHYLAGRERQVLYRRIEITAMRADGREFPVELTITRNLLEGPPLFTGYIRDISERKRIEQERDHLFIQERVARAQAEEARRQMTFLAEASTLLASSLDHETTLARVARLAVPYLADGCVVDILEEDQTVRRLAVAATDPSKEELGRELIRRYPPGPNDSDPLQRVLQTGKPIFLPLITEEMLASVARDEEYLKIARSLDMKSAIIVPLLARERTLGAISFVLTDSDRRYRPADLALAEDLARRAGMAVDNARLYRAAQEEIKERKRAEDHLQFLADHDPLTRLPNRVVFADRLGQAIHRARRHPNLIAVLFLDLDGFKSINDSLGHAVGDQLLKEIADRLVHSVRQSDTVARLGGDEFTLILADLEEAQDIPGITQAILNLLAKPFRLEGYKLSVTASIGISLYPPDGEDPEILLKKADKAMYLAKERGKNNYQFYSPLDISRQESFQDPA